MHHETRRIRRRGPAPSGSSVSRSRDPPHARATLTTLGERLQPGEASDLAAELPMEIDWFLHDANSGQIFDYQAFVQRVAERANADRSDAAYYAQVVVDVVDEATQESEMQDVRAQLPAEYDDLFELVGADYYDTE